MKRTWRESGDQKGWVQQPPAVSWMACGAGVGVGVAVAVGVGVSAAVGVEEGNGVLVGGGEVGSAAACATLTAPAAVGPVGVAAASGLA